MDRVPNLKAKPPGLVMRSLARVVPGIREVSAQIGPYTQWWDDQNQRALAADGPLLAVIGDSTAIGIGASAPESGYINLVRQALSHQDQKQWRVINMAQSGARTADGLERQLPVIEALHAGSSPPALTICVIGTNDVVWSNETAELRKGLSQLIGCLPEGALVGPVAGGSERARTANRAIRNAAGERGLSVIDLWNEPGPPAQDRLAADRFHPNDVGHSLMAKPFIRHLNTGETGTR